LSGDVAWAVVVAFDSGPERLSGVGDVADVIRPYPLTRGGAVVAMWRVWGPSKGGDVAWLVIVGIGDEHALT